VNAPAGRERRSVFWIVVIGHDARLSVRCGPWRSSVPAPGRCAFIGLFKHETRALAPNRLNSSLQSRRMPRQERNPARGAAPLAGIVLVAAGVWLLMGMS
jgi:hypothetical protein